MQKEYAVDLYNHLRRARKLLDSGVNNSLFYTAFEIRCGVESRIQEYLNAREDISKKKKQGWKIAAAGKELDKVFQDGLQIVEVVIHSQATGDAFPFFHTPVVPELRKAVGRLGDLLHAQPETIPSNSSWWGDTRGFLESTFDMAADLARGTLLAPLLLSPAGGISLKAYFHKENPISSVFKDTSPFSKGSQMQIKVEYHDRMPERAAPFLNAWQEQEA